MSSRLISPGMRLQSLEAGAVADFRKRDDQAWNGAGIHALRRLGGRGKSVSYMREYPALLVGVGISPA